MVSEQHPRIDARSRSLQELVSGIDEAIASEAGPPSGSVGSAKEATQDCYVAFSVAGILFAAPVPSIQEMGRIPAITPVPNVPDWLLGVTNMRGDIVSVVDMRGFLGLDPAASPEQGRILLVRGPIATCLLVDQVEGIIRIPRDRLQAPDAPSQDKASKYLKGFYHGADQLTTVLDMDKMLESPEMRQFE